MAKPVAGLPLRMAFTCRWHRRNAAIAVCGGIAILIGVLIRSKTIAIAGIVILAIPAASLGLMLLLGLLFVAISKLVYKD